MNITIVGHRYHLVDPARCPAPMLTAIRDALAGTEFDTMQPAKGEPAEAFFARKAESVADAAVPLLSVMLLPEGVTEEGWSPQIASRTRRRLHELPPAVHGAALRRLAHLAAVRLIETVAARIPITPCTIH